MDACVFASTTEQKTSSAADRRKRRHQVTEEPATHIYTLTPCTVELLHLPMGLLNKHANRGDILYQFRYNRSISWRVPSTVHYRAWMKMPLLPLLLSFLIIVISLSHMHHVYVPFVVLTLVPGAWLCQHFERQTLNTCRRHLMDSPTVPPPPLFFRGSRDDTACNARDEQSGARKSIQASRPLFLFLLVPVILATSLSDLCLFCYCCCCYSWCGCGFIPDFALVPSWQR